MKLLKIENDCGLFLTEKEEFAHIDKINKEDILRLVGLILKDQLVDIESYDQSLLKNQAHQVIYKSISQKLNALRSRRDAFIDEAARLYLEDYERYREGSPHNAAS